MGLGWLSSSLINESVVKVSELLITSSTIKGADKVSAGTDESSSTLQILNSFWNREVWFILDIYIALQEYILSQV